MSKPSTDASIRYFRLLGYVSVLLMVGLGGAWSALASLNGAVIAPSTIMSESNAKRVQQKEGGIVQRILVKDGERVVEGQPLIDIDDTEVRSELAIIDSLLIEELAKRARLEAQLADQETISFPEELMKRSGEQQIAKMMGSQTRLHTARRAALTGKIDQLNQQVIQISEQIEGLDAQVVAMEHQISLIKNELVDLRKLQKDGLMQKSRVLAMEREQARLEGGRGELIGARAAAKSRSSEIKLRIIQLKEDELSQALIDLRQSESRISELEERRIAAAEKLDRLVVRAPITGTIFQLAVHTEGGVITPAETLMMISPEADDLILEAHVLPRNIEQVSVGQEARVRFTAFDTHTTPEVSGEVFSVASDTTRLSNETPPFYIVRIRISAGEIAKIGQHKLKPGMPAEAFIQTGARSPLSYLVKPLRDQIEHVWREQ